MWELGEQLVQSGKVFMRKYAIPLLDEAEDSHVEEVTLPGMGEVYRVRSLIPVINLCSYAPLTRWTRSRDMVRVIEIRSKALSSTLEIYRPTLEQLNPSIGHPNYGSTPPTDPGPTVTLNTGQAIAWGEDKTLLLEPQLTFPIQHGQRLSIPLYGEEVLEVSHSPGPRGKDEDDDVLIQSIGVGTPPGYGVPTDFPNDPSKERIVMTGFIGRSKGWA